MTRLDQLAPDVNTFLELEAPEVAGLILEQLAHRSVDRRMLNVGQYLHAHPHCHFSEYPANRWSDVVERLMEGWAWLIANGLLAPDARQPSEGWIFVTRLGKKVATATRLREYRNVFQLPKERLHPKLAENCHALYVRGEFAVAVFQAFKTLEVDIREASGLHNLIGVRLARRAFAPGDGPLTDKNADMGEQQGLCDLMAGALGAYKNPHSHRDVDVKPKDAPEMITLASHLLRIVDLAWAKTVI